MSDLVPRQPTDGLTTGPSTGPAAAPQAGNLGDILERVLDKGIVIAGDIQINLLDIELLTIRLRLIVASVDTARRMGINWWETDPRLSAASGDSDHKPLRERVTELERRLEASGRPEDERSLEAGDLEEDNRALREQVAKLERQLERRSRRKAGDG